MRFIILEEIKSALPKSPFYNGPLQWLSDDVVQNRHTGEQMMHWDMLNKENLVAFFNMSQCVIYSLVWRFCTT